MQTPPDEPGFDWKVSKKAQIDQKNALELLKMAQFFRPKTQ